MESNALRIARIERSATQQAVETYKAAAEGVLPLFVDFTSTLIDNVFETIVGSSLKQLEAYADLVSKVAGGIGAYEERVFGGDLAKKGDEYLDSEILPQFASEPVSVSSTPNSPVKFLPERLEDLRGIFSGVVATIGTAERAFDDELAEASTTSPPSMPLSSLQAFAKAKLRKEVRGSFDRLETILRLGLQRTVVTEGEIMTSITLHIDSQETQSRTSSNTSTSNSSSGRGFGLNAVGGKTGLLGKILQGSFGGGFSSSRSQVNYSVNVVNENKSSVTNLAIDITGKVSLKFKTDYFPLIDPSKIPVPAADQVPQPALASALAQTSTVRIALPQPGVEVVVESGGAVKSQPA